MEKLTAQKNIETGTS